MYYEFHVATMEGAGVLAHGIRKRISVEGRIDCRAFARTPRPRYGGYTMAAVVFLFRGIHGCISLSCSNLFLQVRYLQACRLSHNCVTGIVALLLSLSG